MKTLLLTFDLEEFDVPLSYNVKISEEEMLKTSYKGILNLLPILEKHNCICTFFVTWSFAKSFPNMIKKLIENGHEIALHALKHKHRYDKMPEKQAYNYLKKAKSFIEKKFNINIQGFRAPQMSRPSYKILNKLGFKYDSSLHPTYIPGYYNNFFTKRKIFIKENIIEIPISVTPIIRAPFSWLWFRNFPLIYSKICTRLSLINTNYINLYFHPWEFVDLSEYKEKITYLIIRNTGPKLLKKFDDYLKFSKLNSSSIKEFLRAIK